MTPSRTKTRRRGLLPAVLLASSVGAVAHAQAVDVAHVSLQIGQAWVVRADGGREPLVRGAAIRIGDRVETAANGHVHMRFIDNAAVSVRPDSVLQIQAYAYDAARPQANEVRLLVEKGTSRSISGAATEADKSRFRLNTPIAAIGIRGTDFIVQADPRGVRASVADGAIVMSPLGGACSASGLGPCAGAEVRELSAEMGRLLAEVRPGERTTQIVPTEDLSLIVTAAAGERPQLRSERSAAMAARASGLLAAEPTEAEARRGNDTAAAALLTLAPVGRPPTVGEPSIGEPSVGEPASVPDLNRASSESGKLMWGYFPRERWGADERDKVSAHFSQAQVGRHITVADMDAGLFRSNQTVPGELFPSTLQGTVEFSLSRAVAFFEVDERSEAASISRSNLTIDFTRRTFATGLDLKSASGVQGELRAAGTIRTDGIFVVREGPIDQRAEQRVAGAISLDGREAGYLFERSAGGGWFRGRTLWGP